MAIVATPDFDEIHYTTSQYCDSPQSHVILKNVFSGAPQNDLYEFLSIFLELESGVILPSGVESTRIHVILKIILNRYIGGS